MAADIGPKIGIDGEKEFKDALKACQAQLKTLGSEMKAVTAEFQDNASSMEALSAKSSVLNKSIAANDEQMRVLTAQYDRQRSSLDNLAAELEAVKQEYGETSKEVGAAQNAYNRQYQALASTENAMNKTRASTANLKKQLSDLETGVDDVGDAMDDAGEKTLSFGDILKADLLADAIKSGLKAIASGIKSLIGGAVEGYAEYEQLVGGVETLFKDSSKTVQDYANNAYKTAGLSANEYMETVTSFSASLLQSMGNDTQAAAQKANVAITDMSDNANKMGTDMSAIQNAYQGFAKQNYTMLDNLKLGYGGTKTEMERLIADANALNAAQGNYTNYSIESYADIVDAIHTVQTEMGITGTTALEASTTIEGSVNAMRSAWSNLVAGLANDNADMDTLVGNLMDSLTTAGSNVIPRVIQVLTSISEVIAQNAGTIVPMIVNTLTDTMPALITAGASLLGALGEGIADNLPTLLQTAIDIVMQLADGLIAALPEMVPAAMNIVVQIVETLLDNIDQLIDAAISMVMALADGLISALPKLIAKVPEIIVKLVTALVNNIPKIIEAAVKLMVGLGTGLIKAIPELIKAIPEIIVALVNGFLELRQKIIDVGVNLIKGLWEGIQSMASWISDKVTGFFSGIVDGVKGLLGIHSPSRVFAGIGKNMALGLGEGFDKQMDSVSASIQSAIPTPTVDTVYNAAAGMVNGLAAANTANGGSYTINLVLQNGAQIASWLLPDIRTAAKNNPEVATA